MNRCVVNVAVDDNNPANYVLWQQRLLSSLDEFKRGEYDRLIWTSGYPPNSPKHSESPYGFKLYAIKEAVARGYTTVLWLDAGNYAIAPIDPIFDAIEECGFYLIRDDSPLARFCSDETLRYYGMTREDAKKIHLSSGSVVGIDFRNAKARAIYEAWWDGYNAGLYRGTVSKHSGQEDHRGDESILAILYHRHGMTYRTRAEHCAGDGNSNSTTVMRSGYVPKSI